MNTYNKLVERRQQDRRIGAELTALSLQDGAEHNRRRELLRRKTDREAEIARLGVSQYYDESFDEWEAVA